MFLKGKKITTVLNTKMFIVAIVKIAENNYSNLKCPILSSGCTNYNKATC